MPSVPGLLALPLSCAALALAPTVLDSIPAAQATPAAAANARAAGSDVGHPLGAGRSESSVFQSSHGLCRDGAELWALGPDYKARFDGRGFEFHPALGAAVERNLTLRFEFEALMRGDELLVPAAAAPRLAIEGQTASYLHGGGLRESYESRRDGLEQSFVLGEPLGGSGDLVVRGRIATSLPQPGDGITSAGLDFVLDGIGGVRIGGVLGIDAHGRTVPGWLRLAGDQLELGLPGAFVDAAAYPLVLDPLIGATIPVASGFDEADPDLSYDDATDSYLVVWERQFSGTDIDIRGQRVSGAGELIGGAIAIDATSDSIALDPVVGNANGSSRWMVAWQQAASLLTTPSVLARRVTAATGSTSSTILAVDASAAAALTPDISNANTADDFMVVWEENGAGIRSRMIGFDAQGEPQVDPDFGAVAQVSLSGVDARPRISKSGSAFSQWCVVWQRFFNSPPPGDYDLAARQMSFTGAPLSGTAGFGLIGPSEESPDIDGDATDFMVVYERENNVGSGDRGIFAQPLVFDGLGLEWGLLQIIENDLNDDESAPAIAFTGEAYAATFVDEFASGDDGYVVTLEPVSGKPCGAPSLLSATGDVRSMAIASRYLQGAVSGDGALVVWELTALDEFDGDLYAQRYETLGEIEILGGGCGNGNIIEALAAAATVGNADFTHWVRNADVGAQTYLLLSLDRLDLPCSGCVLVPDITSGFVLAGGAADSNGNADVPMPIANDAALAGLAFYEQWAVTDSQDTCALFGVNFSPALRITIQ